MPDWFRFWKVEPHAVARSAGYVLLGSLTEQDSHLRTYVSWYIESTTLNAATEPLFVGVVAVHVPDGTPPSPPPDPGAENDPIAGDWWQTETCYPQLIQSRSTARVVWPAGGSRTWDIKTNRRVDPGQSMRYYLRWAGPTDLAANLRSVVTWSTLVEMRG